MPPPQPCGLGARAGGCRERPEATKPVCAHLGPSPRMSRVTALCVAKANVPAAGDRGEAPWRGQSQARDIPLSRTWALGATPTSGLGLPSLAISLPSSGAHASECTPSPASRRDGKPPPTAQGCPVLDREGVPRARAEAERRLGRRQEGGAEPPLPHPRRRLGSRPMERS